MSDDAPGLALVRQFAEMEARAVDSPDIGPEHFWLGLTRLLSLDGDELQQFADNDIERTTRLRAEIDSLKGWLENEGIDPTRTGQKLRRTLRNGSGAPDTLHRSEASRRAFATAKDLAGSEGASFTEPLHLAKAIFRNPPPAMKSVGLVGADIDALLGRVVGKPDRTRNSRYLGRFGRDLTALAERGRLEPLVGRNDELRHLAQVLTRKRKRNALLVGPAGIGKTALVHGLARLLASQDCPPVFKNRYLLEISLDGLLAGTKYRGELEERLKGVIDEAIDDPDVILFLDEFHQAAGRSGNGTDIANILKPRLDDGRLCVIGATTDREFESSVGNDDALLRRFETIWLTEPSRAEALEIVEGVAPGLENHHGLGITPEARRAAVELSARFLADQRLPDKAIDLLDQAASRQVLPTLDLGTKVSARALGRAEIAEVVAERCKMPLPRIMQSERDRLRDLKDFLNGRVLGQDVAMRRIHEVLHTAEMGLRDDRRPLATFLFAGPTGVGKTETGKALADFLFGGGENLVRVDLSEYMERHQVARLLGSPPGYVRSDEPGWLTKAMRKRPASVVLFDEIEKAHPDVLNVLLQILDEGQLTDGQGRVARFQEAIIILTTNVGGGEAASTPLGFAMDKDGDGAGGLSERRLLDLLRKDMAPELLGRIGAVVPFQKLTPATLRRLAGQVFDRRAERLRARGTELPGTLRASVISDVLESPFGARDLERRVEQAISAWLRDNPDLVGAKPEEVPEPGSPVPRDQVSPDLEKRPAPIPTVDRALLAIDWDGADYDLPASDIVARIRTELRVRDYDADLVSTTAVDNGLLVLCKGVPAAFQFSDAALDMASSLCLSVRMALHWGGVQEHADVDDIPRSTALALARLGAVASEAETDGAPGRAALPAANRLLVTESALSRLDAAARALLRPAGRFVVAGHDVPIALWMAEADSQAPHPDTQTALLD